MFAQTHLEHVRNPERFLPGAAGECGGVNSNMLSLRSVHLGRKSGEERTLWKTPTAGKWSLGVGVVTEAAIPALCPSRESLGPEVIERRETPEDPSTRSSPSAGTPSARVMPVCVNTLAGNLQLSHLRRCQAGWASRGPGAPLSCPPTGRTLSQEQTCLHL